MIKIEFNAADLIAQAQRLNASVDQIPYALALAMNHAAENTRNLLIQNTWPTSVHARNSSFIAASLTTRGARADKNSLTVEIYDKLDRGNLQMQAKGGTRTPRGGANLAVPSSQIGRTSRGVPSNLRPKALTPSATLRKGDVLYQRDKRGRLRLLYVLKHATPIPKRVPFEEDFATSMSNEMRTSIPAAVERAMSTRR